MALDRYGVWRAKAVEVTAETAADDDESPHIHFFYDDGDESRLRASINVKSKSAISELALYHQPMFDHPVLSKLEQARRGFTPLESKPNTLALDYLRGNLLRFEDGVLLPHDIPGRENDLLDMIMPVLERAVAKGSEVFLFGEPYGDNKGIHNIHMNQGNVPQFARDNGVWQDGGVIIEDRDFNRYVALFLAFGSQAIHTSENGGRALPGSMNIAQLLGRQPPIVEPVVEPGVAPVVEPGGGEPGPVEPIVEDRRVAIVGALVNPVGGENQPDHRGRPELVYLMNRSAAGVSLKGWSILNRADDPHVLSSDVWLAPGEVRAVAVSDAPLSNKGGLITLLDPGGVKVDGVSYTRDEAREDGQIVLFRR